MDTSPMSSTCDRVYDCLVKFFRADVIASDWRGVHLSTHKNNLASRDQRSLLRGW